jgi:formamidopyrimidine-DNA glycosylase
VIELPEALTIAKQISKELKGKKIKEGTGGNSPHKFAFYGLPREKYHAILKGKVVRKAEQRGSMIVVSLEPEHVLVLGEGGERILFHESAGTLPKKHQLWLHFTDDTHLTVSVQGWGAVALLRSSELAGHWLSKRMKPSPLSDQFTPEHFLALFDELEEEGKRSLKFFVISEPGIAGIGSGCLQDILFRARLHPRRRAVATTKKERRALYTAIRSVLKEMVGKGGRDSDHDLYDQPGGYKRILHSKVVGEPCPRCGTAIEKIQYLGGACYFCPSCQT